MTVVRQLDWETTYDAEAYLALLDTFSGHIAMEGPRATACTARSAAASPSDPTAGSGGTGARCCTWPPHLR